MTELKTLKDVLFQHGAKVYFVEFSIAERNIGEKLREAAEEWVQALKDSLAEGLVEEHIMKRDAKIELIKQFFNLEDED